jgi:hypothetical protein
VLTYNALFIYVRHSHSAAGNPWQPERSLSALSNSIQPIDSNADLAERGARTSLPFLRLLETKTVIPCGAWTRILPVPHRRAVDPGLSGNSEVVRSVEYHRRRTHHCSLVEAHKPKAFTCSSVS